MIPCPALLLESYAPGEPWKAPGALLCAIATIVSLGPDQAAAGTFSLPWSSRFGRSIEGTGIETGPPDRQDVPGECSVYQHLDDFALRHVLRQNSAEALERFGRDDDCGLDSSRLRDDCST